MPKRPDIDKAGRKIERITGLQVTGFWHDGEIQFVGATRQGVVIGFGPTLRDAVDTFLEDNRKRLVRIKRQEQDDRCKLCTSTGPLQLDHIRPRARGRNDRPENVQLLCVACHRKKHDPRAAGN